MPPEERTTPKRALICVTFAFAGFFAASLWAFLTTDNFHDAVLKGINLGDDTDTIGSVTGGMAGLYYGFDQIPSEWINQLARKDDIFELVNRFSRLE